MVISVQKKQMPALHNRQSKQVKPGCPQDKERVDAFKVASFFEENDDEQITICEELVFIMFNIIILVPCNIIIISKQLFLLVNHKQLFSLVYLFLSPWYIIMFVYF